jgi:hypothetical protein
MDDFATRFSQAKSAEEFSGLVGDVVRRNPGGLDPIFALIGIAAEMATRGSKLQRTKVVEFMRAQALAVDAGPQ